MAIAITIQNYLKDLGIDYAPLPHAHTETASTTAEASHVPGARLVKAVVIKEDGGYKMALLPASHHLLPDRLADLLDGEVELASEAEFVKLFDDCDAGAIPALGMAYGLDVIVEDELAKSGELYFEGGDHETLVRVPAEAFGKLTADAPHGHFSRVNR